MNFLVAMSEFTKSIDSLHQQTQYYHFLETKTHTRHLRHLRTGVDPWCGGIVQKTMQFSEEVEGSPISLDPLTFSFPFSKNLTLQGDHPRMKDTW